MTRTLLNLYPQFSQISVLHSDYTTGLSYLMKYPTNIDVLLIIRHSLHMYAPDVRYNPLFLPFN